MSVVFGGYWFCYRFLKAVALSSTRSMVFAAVKGLKRLNKFLPLRIWICFAAFKFYTSVKKLAFLKNFKYFRILNFFPFQKLLNIQLFTRKMLTKFQTKCHWAFKSVSLFLIKFIADNQHDGELPTLFYSLFSENSCTLCIQCFTIPALFFSSTSKVLNK